MKRRLVNALVLLSLIACAAALYAWPRSYLPEDCTIYQADGSVGLLFTDWGESRQNHSAAAIVPLLRGVAQTHGRRLGFEYMSGNWRQAGSRHNRFIALAVPHAALVALTAVGPAWWWIASRHQRRRRLEGRCLRCGYDLRESPGKCPECGQVSVSESLSAADAGRTET